MIALFLTENKTHTQKNSMEKTEQIDIFHNIISSLGLDHPPPRIFLQQVRPEEPQTQG